MVSMGLEVVQKLSATGWTGPIGLVAITRAATG